MWTEVRSGIPQGSVLGPILFVIYINYLPDVISSYVYMYADDTKIFRVNGDDGDADSLQRDLDAASEWRRKWLLSFNHDKCKVLEVIGMGGRGKNHMHQYTLEVNGKTGLHLWGKVSRRGTWVLWSAATSCFRGTSRKLSQKQCRYLVW